MIRIAGVELTEATVTGRPAWRHDPSGVVFRLVPAGSFQMGFSDRELATIEALCDDELEWQDDYAERSRPVRAVSVPSFLMAWHPLTAAQARCFLPGYNEGDQGEDEHAAAALHSLECLDQLLAALPFRLPSEAEWEYAARAGTATLTYRGDQLPDQDTDLLSSFGDEVVIRRHENRFGVAAMGSVLEACADTYRPGYSHAPRDAEPYLGQGSRVSRGGAADCSPWQGCGEEALMFSGFRAAIEPDTVIGMINAGIRPALDWPPASS
ncbi:SUMF1/EgtB/PvdO family nonheme iron enzyme [Actinoplanes sp. NPDC049118]|uniref:formylglycine-generating enzyme family protein n=1 Tax=Actinoplanes sp. NPDC049118 TaxID=3155769 RepID=UPI0033E3AC82